MSDPLYTFSFKSDKKDVTFEVKGDKSPEDIFPEFLSFLNACGHSVDSDKDSQIKIEGEDALALAEDHHEDTSDNVDFFYSDLEESQQEAREIISDTSENEVLANTPEAQESAQTEGPREPSPHELKVAKLEGAIIPFLENLTKNPDKVILRWPNRHAMIKSKIDEINGILRN